MKRCEKWDKVSQSIDSVYLDDAFNFMVGEACKEKEKTVTVSFIKVLAVSLSAIAILSAAGAVIITLAQNNYINVELRPTDSAFESLINRAADTQMKAVINEKTDFSKAVKDGLINDPSIFGADPELYGEGEKLYGTRFGIANYTFDRNESPKLDEFIFSSSFNDIQIATDKYGRIIFILNPDNENNDNNDNDDEDEPKNYDSLLDAAKKYAKAILAKGYDFSDFVLSEAHDENSRTFEFVNNKGYRFGDKIVIYLYSDGTIETAKAEYCDINPEVFTEQVAQSEAAKINSWLESNASDISYVLHKKYVSCDRGYFRAIDGKIYYHAYVEFSDESGSEKVTSTEDFIFRCDGKEPFGYSLEEQARRMISENKLRLQTSFVNQETGGTVEYYTADGGLTDDILPVTENGLYYIERSKDGSVVNFCDQSKWSRIYDYEINSAHPHTFTLLYNEGDKSAHLFRFSKDEEIPTLSVYRDKSFEQAQEIYKNVSDGSSAIFAGLSDDQYKIYTIFSLDNLSDLTENELSSILEMKGLKGTEVEVSYDINRVLWKSTSNDNNPSYGGFSVHFHDVNFNEQTSDFDYSYPEYVTFITSMNAGSIGNGVSLPKYDNSISRKELIAKTIPYINSTTTLSDIKNALGEPDEINEINASQDLDDKYKTNEIRYYLNNQSYVRFSSSSETNNHLSVVYVINSVYRDKSFEQALEIYKNVSDGSSVIFAELSDEQVEAILNTPDKLLVVSGNPFLVYDRSKLTKDSNGYLKTDRVFLYEIERFRINYNDINNAADSHFDENGMYFGELSPTERDRYAALAPHYVTEITKGDKIGNLTVRECYSAYSDGLFMESEDDEKATNHISQTMQQYIAFDGEITLKGYAMKDASGNVFFSVLPSSYKEAFGLAFESRIIADFAKQKSPDGGKTFVYTSFAGDKLDISGKLTEESFGTGFVKEVELTLKNPELSFNKTGEGGLRNGLFGEAVSIKDLGTIY